MTGSQKIYKKIVVLEVRKQLNEREKKAKTSKQIRTIPAKPEKEEQIYAFAINKRHTKLLLSTFKSEEVQFVNDDSVAKLKLEKRIPIVALP